MKLLVCCFCLMNFVLQAQIKLENTSWITQNDFLLTFTESHSNLTDLDFASRYEINGDTLHFKHDFSYIIEVTRGEEVVPQEDYELPDSYFIIERISADSLTLKAINPTALYMINKLTKNYFLNLSDKEVIQWEKGEKPEHISSKIDNRITFWNQKTIEKTRQIHAIELSTHSEGWYGSGYCDIIINADLSYSCRMISKGYNKNDRAQTTYYKGKLSDSEFKKIERLYGQTNLPDSANTDYFKTWSSHDIEFEMKIVHDYGVTEVSGIRSSLPDFVRPFFDSVQGDFITDADKVKEMKTTFSLTQYEKKIKQTDR